MFRAWATDGIRRSRDVLYELYERKSYTPNPDFQNYVRKYSKIFKQVCIQAKSAYISEQIKKADDKVKMTWKVINRETGRGKFKTSDICLKIEDKIVTDKTQIANYLENFFTNIPIETTKYLQASPVAAEKLFKENIKMTTIQFPPFVFKSITSTDILNAFRSLTIKKSEDIWGLSVKAIQAIIVNVAPFLATIFNTCIKDGVFPDLMKYSKIVPIFKAGCATDASNYRPVSVLPTLSKIFERIMLNQMLTYFNNTGLLHKNQFGFTKGRSTEDAGSTLIKTILGAWEEWHDAIGVFCDLSKAFDCVNHDTLILKLKLYGIKDKSLDLLISYLSNREQKVAIENVISKGSQVKIGVPQGSILGPFLFLVYINDLPYTINQSMSNIVLFADDTSLIFKVNRKDRDLVQPNSTLDAIATWFSANNLLLNSGKTKCIKFTTPNVTLIDSNISLDGKLLDLVPSTVFLGITVDSKLQWGPHIQALASKLSSAAYAVRRIRQLTDIATARLVYFAYFHSIMSYGILLWGSAADVETIFILQKRAVRAIYNLGSRDSLRELFKKINILTLPSVYILTNIMYIRKNISVFNKNSDIHSLNTRNKHKLMVPGFRLSRTSKSFIGNSIRFYNKIPSHINDLPDKKFKQIVKRTLASKAYYSIKQYMEDKNAWSSVPPCMRR